MRNDSPKTRVFELDVLRFLAAFAVVLYHLTYRNINGQALFGDLDVITRFGFLGVNLFFMISGFVILWTAVGRTPVQFMISRFSRLYPIFWVAIAITLLGIWIMQGETFDLAQILANMTMVAGYLNQEYIDNVYWTLQVEIKFYVLVFILIMFKQVNNIERWLIVWLIGCVASYYVPVLSIVTIHPYGPYFISGATLYLVWKERLTPVKSLILLACLIMSLIETMNVTPGYIFGQDPLDSKIAAAIVFGCYIMMLAIALGHMKIGERQYLFRMAMMTYPLYLLHSKLGKMIFDNLGMNKYISLFIVLVFILGLCYVLAVYVDRPLNKASNKKLYKLHDILVNK